MDEFLYYAREAGIVPAVLDRQAFLRTGGLTDDDKHQGIFIVTRPRPILGEQDLGLLDSGSLVLVLDQISDPQNFGTVLRNAAFFGADAVIWLKDRSAELSPTVLRISVGGAEFVPLFQVTNLARTLDHLKETGFWVYGLDEDGPHTLAQTDFAEKSALVIGAEGEGLRRRTREHCDALVRIPGGRLGLESLNAGVAAAVALAELTRTRPERDRTKHDRPSQDEPHQG